MNLITLGGHLGADAEVRYTPSGDAVCGFRLAVNMKNRGEDSTVWYECNIWGKRGEALAEYLTKGKLVFLSGRLAPPEIYEKRDGSSGVSLKVNVNEIDLGGSRADAGAVEPSQASGNPPQKRPQNKSRKAPAEAEFNDDIPF